MRSKKSLKLLLSILLFFVATTIFAQNAILNQIGNSKFSKAHDYCSKCGEDGGSPWDC